jgi:sn-glycerol 3-phosphate transport system substrate-binding protein
VEFWHGLAQPLGGLLEKIVADFNASQSQYQVNPSFKGSYPETMVAAIAASGPATRRTSCRCLMWAPPP